MKNKELWKKWWFWVIIAIFCVLPFATNDDKKENNSTTDSNIEETEESKLKSDLFGDSDDKANYFFDNEKTIRKFVLAYNEKANVKITNVTWTNNHKIANIRFDNMQAKFNTGSDTGFLIEFEFGNGKEMINNYKVLIKDIILTFDSDVQEDKFNESFNNALTNQQLLIKVTDNISISVHYSKDQVGYKSGDRYYIDITCINYNK